MAEKEGFQNTWINYFPVYIRDYGSSASQTASLLSSDDAGTIPDYVRCAAQQHARPCAWLCAHASAAVMAGTFLPARADFFDWIRCDIMTVLTTRRRLTAPGYQPSPYRPGFLSNGSGGAQVQHKQPQVS